MTTFVARAARSSRLGRRSIATLQKRNGTPVFVSQLTGPAVVPGGDAFWSPIGLLIGQIVGGAVMTLRGVQGRQSVVSQAEGIHSFERLCRVADSGRSAQPPAQDSRRCCANPAVSFH
jgi:hypothetical protein